MTGPMNLQTKPKPVPKLATELLARFVAIVGEKYALTDPQAQTPYLVEMRDLYRGHTPVVLRPGSREAVPTGLTMAIPEGYEGQVRPRSGLALRAGVTCLNSPGTVDADYRGEVKVILVNLGAEDFTIRRGDRIAQLLIAPVTRADWREAASLDETGRGAGGFGSTGHG